MIRRKREDKQSVVSTVVQCLADTVGRDPMELEPFAETIDADAVESLFESVVGDAPRSLSVEYEGCSVTITPDEVAVDRLSAVNASASVDHGRGSVPSN